MSSFSKREKKKKEEERRSGWKNKLFLFPKKNFWITFWLLWNIHPVTHSSWLLFFLWPFFLPLFFFFWENLEREWKKRKRRRKTGKWERKKVWVEVRMTSVSHHYTWWWWEWVMMNERIFLLMGIETFFFPSFSLSFSLLWKHIPCFLHALSLQVSQGLKRAFSLPENESQWEREKKRKREIERERGRGKESEREEEEKRVRERGENHLVMSETWSWLKCQ